MRLRLSVFLVVGAEVPAAVLRPAVLRDERVLFLRRGLVLAPVVAFVEHELAVLDQRVCVLVAGPVQLYRHANGSSASRGALAVPSSLAGYHYSSEGSRLRAGSPLPGAGGVGPAPGSRTPAPSNVSAKVERGGVGALHAIAGLRQHVPEDADHLVELLLPRDERRRDLDHGVAAVVRPADQAALEQRAREEAAQQPLALLVGERLARVLVLDELERVEEAGPTQVADDRQRSEERRVGEE